MFLRAPPPVYNELVAVTFIFDYVQLMFNPSETIISIYSKCYVSLDGQRCTLGDKGFADLLVSLIHCRVAQIDDASSQAYSIVFDSGATIAISLLPEDQKGPEAAEIAVPNKPIVVVQPS